MNFYISDWHYNHANCIRFDPRPFATVEEMNTALISRWNQAVTREDTVYILGDMFWCNNNAAVPVLEQLNGTKYLIRGSHDICKLPEFLNQFQQISEYMEIKDGPHNLVLCHYPIPCFKNHMYGWIHLYGHVHTSPEYEVVLQTQQNLIKRMKAPCEMYNVGAMLPYIDYTPRTLQEIRAQMSSIL